MTTARRRMLGTDTTTAQARDALINTTPELNVYEIHSERTVFTEPDNTDGWIATNMTVTPQE